MSRVAIARCTTYEASQVADAVRAALAPLGGIEAFVRPRMRVLLKPNMLLEAELEQAVTTHPVVVEAVAALAVAAGGDVWIGDSPGGPKENSERLWEPLGMRRAAEGSGAGLVPFKVAEWKRLNERDYFICRPMLEADLVINLAKPKTHVTTLYTGAVKNLFGAVPGRRKREVHCWAPHADQFADALVDIAELVWPGLTIMDGVVGQEGEGPGTSGTPRHFGIVAASADAVALDTVITDAMGYQRGRVLHVVKAGERGLGEGDLSRIDVVGDVDALGFGKVDIPKAMWVVNVPPWIGRLMGDRIVLSPEFSEDACTGCARCVESCPKDALTKGIPPTVDLDECIGCMCCAELCPQAAVETKRSLLSRLLGIQ
jgi:uncharacterized protein (DUF362 family)/Pyruvate/2-oxoacid:ferredoxin oxidoreductase delta subunit